jgi:hypothetical protein
VVGAVCTKEPTAAVSSKGTVSSRASCVVAAPTLRTVTVAPVRSPSVRANPDEPAGSPA